MNNRVTTSTFTRNAIHFTSLHQAQLLKTQRQIASGVAFELPSEKPMAFRQVRSLESRRVELQSDQHVVGTARGHLNAGVGALQEMTDLITNARNLVQQGIQSIDDNERETLAIEIEAILDQAQRIAMTQHDEKYLFGGARSDRPPFSFGPPVHDNGPLSVAYQGVHRQGQSHVGDTLTVDTLYDGSRVFGSSGRGETIMVGATGARHGGGTDTLIGRATLQIRHTATTYAGGSGVQPGIDSAERDNIIGPPGAYQLTVEDTSGTGAAGFVALSGGEPVAFTDADTNLEVIGPSGEVVYVDTTSIAAGFVGTVDIEATGTLSVDGGTSTQPITFGPSQVVTDAGDGRYVTIDSSNIRLAGDEALEFSGTSNLFQVLKATADDLRNARGFSNAEYAESLGRRLADLEESASMVFDAMGQQATSLRTLRSLEYRIEDLVLSSETSISELQSTDFPDAVMRLTSSQTLLQYTYAVTAEVSTLGLIDFLR